MAQDRIAQLQEQIASRAARPAEAQEETEAVLAFILAGERYALPLNVVREVSRLLPITPLPGLPAAVLGAAGLRGEVLPVLDLRRILALPEAPTTEASRLIVVRHEGTVAALLADRVEDIDALPTAAVSPSPGVAGEGPAFLRGVVHQGKRTTRLLDLPRLLEAVRHGA